MSRNGSGIYSLATGNPVTTGTTISSTWANSTLTDIASALTTSIASDGQTVISANIPMNSNKLTGLAAPTVAGDALSFGAVATISTLTTTADASIHGLTVGTGPTNSTSNTIVGNGAFAVNSSGTTNDAFGQNALAANTSGGINSAFGRQSLTTNTTGSNNAAFGYNALGLNSTGASNTALGVYALQANTAGSSVAVGYQAGNSATNGGANTFIGSSAGSAMTTGSQNIIIGYNAAASGVADNFEIVIGPGVTGKGTTTAFISPAGGSVYQGNNAATWAITSDQRLKKNIVDNTTGLSAINAIQVRNFEYRTAEEVTELEAHSAIDIKGVQLGAIAQELQLILPECVKTESTGVMSVDASNLTWYLINAVKELSAKVTALEAKQVP